MSASESGSPEPTSQEFGAERVAIGLSFGNSNSSIAYTNAREGKAEVIANEDGDRQIPSMLSYVTGEEFQGTQAKAQIVRNPRNTIAYFRDFLAHPVEVDGGKAVGFTVQEGEDEGEKSTLTVSEVSTRHLRRLKQSASDFLGKSVNAAVVTVPSDFSDEQKAALSSSAKEAGIEVLQFIPEPISALLAYDAKIQQSGEVSKQQDKVVLVADLGGTRSDVAVVASRGGMYSTLATAHDYELGGSTLDKVLIDYAAKEFLKKNKTAKDPRENERSLSKLTLEAENVKKALSLGASASFSLESLSDGFDFSLSVNRTRFELLANKVLMSFTRLIESAVQKADLDILDIDAVLLSGGASHTPKIASNLQSRFPNATIIAPSTSSTAVNPSELAARGAAIQASLIQEFEQSDIEESTEAVVIVAPHLSHAIGLVTGKEGAESFAVIVEPDTPVPVRRTAQIAVKDGGDVLLRLAEAVREIKISKEDKPTTNGTTNDSDDDEDDSDDEPEEVRSKVWKAGKVLAEAGLKGVKKGGKVEIQVNVAADMTVTVVCREVGGKGGVRGVIEKGAVEQNGSAS
ncbi:Hsp70 protein that interacts with Zuo1p [Vermiconidia calcicola]|uniref:Hsp70 protein that interacts with Zuo1p n=1 Tax=Vermiconidia calcicola TaxID=1690605 RepID=A0ACC3N6M3_9PEZI|nr:Hsp70 protein that interacts with Zuo1p [Vermiconidia calcicola]